MKKHLAEKNVRRFLSKIDTSGGPDACHLWTGYIRPDGYGETSIGLRNTVCHRRIWVMSNGPIEPGLFILHRCDNRPCCNLRHLFKGTQKQNIDDKFAKGREARGRNAGRAVNGLTDDQVREIRQLMASKTRRKVIMAKFERSHGSLNRIARREAFWWVD